MRVKIARGRRKSPRPPVWMLDFNGPGHGTSLAHISMLIKEDKYQTIEELAERLADDRELTERECLRVLKKLNRKNRLGYFSDEDMRWIPWKPWRE